MRAVQRLLTLGSVLVVHITPIDNLAGIVRRGGLWSDSHFAHTNDGPAVVTDPGIKGKRARFHVPDTSNVLADFVPFFFFARNPMTYRLCQENPVDRLLFIVIDTGDYVDDEDVRFTDRHALSRATFHCDLTAMGTLIDQRGLWHRSWAGDDDLGKRLQAEFLVWMTVRKRKFRGFAAPSSQAVATATEVLASSGWDDAPPVKAKPSWFFQ